MDEKQFESAVRAEATKMLEGEYNAQQITERLAEKDSIEIIEDGWAHYNRVPVREGKTREFMLEVGVRNTARCICWL